MLDSVFACVPSSIQSAMGRAPSRLGSSVRVDRGVATVFIDGLLSRSGTWGASYDTIASQVQDAAANADVSSILLHVDSPGGAAAGVTIAADSIAAAARAKRVVAYCDGMAASAAYWLASQANRIIAERTAIVGSIGTYGVLYDSSGSFAAAGVRVHVVKSGEHKGDGVPGTPITDSQLAEFQRIVNGLNEHFLTGVAAGRRLSLDVVRQLGDGRAHLAGDAVTLRLVDAVGSLSEVLTALHKPVQTAEQRWQGAIDSKMQTGLDRRRAVCAVAKENPTLHAEYLNFANHRN